MKWIFDQLSWPALIDELLAEAHRFVIPHHVGALVTRPTSSKAPRCTTLVRKTDCLRVHFHEDL